MSGISDGTVQGSCTWYMMLNLSVFFPFPIQQSTFTSAWIRMLNQNPSPGEVWRESEISLKVCRGHCCFQWEVIAQPFQYTETWLQSACSGRGLFTRTCMRSGQPISWLTSDSPMGQQVSQSGHSLRHPQAFILCTPVDKSSSYTIYIF